MSASKKPPAMSLERQQAAEYHNQGVQGAGGDHQLAYKLLLSACEIDPSFAGAWYAHGNSNSDLDLRPAAVACFRRVLEMPTGPGESGDRDAAMTLKALINIGHRLYHMGRLAEAEEFTRRALEQDPNSSYALINLSMIESLGGNQAECIRLCKKAFALDQTPVVELALAFALLFDRQFIEGLRHFECRFAYKDQNFLKYPYTRWKGEPGQTVYIVGDQGIGDSLSYLRFVAQAAERCRRIVLGIQPEIARMAQDALPMNVEVAPLPHAFPAADFWCPIVSLPVALGLTDAEFINAPGVVVRDYRLPAHWKVLGRFAIGIAWAGSKQNDIDRWRSLALEQFLELYRVPGIQLYSLQVGEHAADVHRFGAAALVKDLSPMIRDATDTAAIIRELDLVITIESFVGHLAGAFGKECWIPASFYGRDYRCGHTGSSSIWYPKHKLFRQGQHESWQPVFDRIGRALRGRLNGND